MELPPEEENILKLLKKIEDTASRDELEQARYEFRGLLPTLRILPEGSSTPTWL